jgi:thiamine biosynthesis lipoprotein
VNSEGEVRILQEDESMIDPLRFEHHAMNTIFEILMIYNDKDYAEKAAYAAFAELDRLEQELSRFLPNSEISRINKLKYLEAVIVSPDTFQCLKECLMLYNLTKGAFDISAGPLIDLWKPKGEKKDSKVRVDPKAIKLALTQIGLPWLHLDSESFSVRLFSSSISLDLGGYGKGYALMRMKEVLEEYGIIKAILHSGYSTVFAYSSKTTHAWPVTFQIPDQQHTSHNKIYLNNQCISGSGIAKGSHVVDPRNGKPIKNRLASWVITDRPDYADALSTAFLIMDDDQINKLCKDRKNIAALIVEKSLVTNKYSIVKKFGDSDIF